MDARAVRALTATLEKRDAELADRAEFMVRAIAGELRREFEERDAARLRKIQKLERQLEERDAELLWRTRPTHTVALPMVAPAEDQMVRRAAVRAALLRAQIELRRSAQDLGSLHSGR
jgi:hypothetical protein